MEYDVRGGVVGSRVFVDIVYISFHIRFLCHKAQNFSVWVFAGLLDLGAWMALQSIVEKHHRLLVKDKCVLTQTIMTGYPSLTAEVLEKSHNLWKMALDLILEDEGNNDKVEDNQGSKDNPIDLADGQDSKDDFTSLMGEEDVVLEEV